MILVVLPSFANDIKTDNKVGIDEKLGEIVPLDLFFIDENNDTLVLTDYIDKPTIVLWYTTIAPGFVLLSWGK